MRILMQRAEIEAFVERLKLRGERVPEEIFNTTKRIVEDVRTNGDRALRHYTERFDSIRPKSLRLSIAEIRRAARRCPKDVYDALSLAAERIRRFHERQLEGSWQYTEDGVTLGQLVRPLRRVGVYVPGGRAAYPSTVLMNVIPAQVAGVDEVALCVPTPQGEINPALMAAVEIVDVREVYRIGGAQAIAALAYGTETVKRVDKIVGPGNIFVALAKKLVYGVVDIDMFAGPSEVLIVADSTARPSFVAADLLSQAEHDEMASSVLVTTSKALAEAVIKELYSQMELLPRRQTIEKAIQNYGGIIIVRNLKRAVEIVNAIAPEHLELLVRKPEALLQEIHSAGAVFLGEYSPEPMGDYLAGPNHTLPTSGTARFFSPLGVYHFLKRTSIIKFSRAAFRRLSGYVMVLSEAEGLQAHGNTVRVRLTQR